MLQLHLHERRLRFLDARARGREARARARQRGFDRIGVELGQQRAGFHRRIEVDMHPAHDAGQLARDVDLVGRLHRTGGGDDDGEVRVARDVGLVADTRRIAAAKAEVGGGAENGEQGQQ